jgi:hypothetical protein
MDHADLTEAEAAAWAHANGLSFPSPADWDDDDAPTWQWHEDTTGGYVGYLPIDWADVPDDRHEAPLLYDHQLYGIEVEYYDLGVATVVRRIDWNTEWSEKFVIPRLADQQAAIAWDLADGWHEATATEFLEYFHGVFEDFDPYEPSTDALVTDAKRMADARGCADQYGPYSEYHLLAYELSDGTYLGVGGPPGDAPEYQRRFDSLDDIANWIHEAANLLGTLPDIEPDRAADWPVDD